MCVLNRSCGRRRDRSSDRTRTLGIPFAIRCSRIECLPKCAASCCTCCRVALCASATSASSPTGGEQNSFRSVSDCSSKSDQPAIGTNSPAALPTQSGTVRAAAEPCRLSSASPPRNSSFDPASSQPVHCMSPHPQHRISLLLRRAHWFCVSHLSVCSMVVRFRLSDAPPHDHSLCHPLLKPKADRNGKQWRIPSSRCI